MTSKTKPTSDDFVRTYYEHQYERMKALEEQRLSITNYVLAVSALAFTFGFQGGLSLTIFNGVGLPLIIIFVNLFAIVYIGRSAKFIHMHQKRAREILRDFAPVLDTYNEKFEWPRKSILGGRTLLQQWLHILLVLTAFIPVGVLIYQIIV